MAVLSDAKKLNWRRGELEKREIAAKGILMGRRSSSKDEEKLDPLYEKKNWNKINSGFRLWGGSSFEGEKAKKTGVDEFLESKNWNDIDSSFRIL